MEGKFGTNPMCDLGLDDLTSWGSVFFKCGLSFLSETFTWEEMNEGTGNERLSSKHLHFSLQNLI